MALKYHELKDRQLGLQRDYDHHVETIPEALRTVSVNTVTTWIQNLRMYTNATAEFTREIDRLSKMRDEMTAQITTVRARIPSDPRPMIEANIVEMNGYQERLDASAQGQRALEAHAEVTRERDRVIEIQQTMSDLQVLRQYATETECAILQQITDQLNDSIQSICSSLFDRDITIMLSLYKTLKTTKHTKPCVNFNIGYQGGQFDNINQISGGEGDRISLALTLALNRLSTSPLIMLDESLASLDLTMKEMAIRTIREHTNSTVLIVMHDGIEGIFDNVVNIDDI
jgi:DNA repair exonuclease SbcCD ATPase subunit